MSFLFKAAGGLIEAQDEALAAALSKATEEPAGLQSLGLINAGESDVFSLGDQCVMGAYGRVGPEDVSNESLEWIASSAEGLQPGQYLEIRQRAADVARDLAEAAVTLKNELGGVLGSAWQGEFVVSALDSKTKLVESALSLSTELNQVADKAQRAYEGQETTRIRVSEQAMAVAEQSGSGTSFSGNVNASAINEIRRRQEAEEQARAIVNHEYSPAVMDANLDDMDFTTAYRVVSGAALGGPNGIDMGRVWNNDGVIRPATAGAPSAAALAAAAGGGAGADVGVAGGGGTSGGAGAGPTTTSSPVAPTNPTTEQALLASRGGAVDGAGAVAAPAGQGASGGGVNASTTAAGAPFVPPTTAGGRQSGAGGGGIPGIRGAGRSNRERDRGFGSAAGLVGGGGAAAAGAAASRLGGAGTLAGIGGAAGLGGGPVGGPSGGGAGAGAFGAGSAGAGAAGSGVGGASSSSGGAQAGRAGAMPMGGMAGASGSNQNSDRKGHTPAGYLTNATNTTAIIGDPLKVSPAVLGRKLMEDPAAEDQPEPFRSRVIGRDYPGRAAN